MTEPLLDGTCPDRARSLASRSCAPGNTNCGGCGMSIALNMLSRAVADRPVQMVIPACCGIVTAGAVPVLGLRRARSSASTFASAAAVATGLAQRGATQRRDDARDRAGPATAAPTTSAWPRSRRRPSATRTSSTSATTTRSTATPAASAPRPRRSAPSTTTTPRGKTIGKKDILAIMAAHRDPLRRVDLARPPRGRDAQDAPRARPRAASASCTCSRPARPAGSRSRPTASS